MPNKPVDSNPEISGEKENSVRHVSESVKKSVETIDNGDTMPLSFEVSISENMPATLMDENWFATVIPMHSESGQFHALITIGSRINGGKPVGTIKMVAISEETNREFCAETDEKMKNYWLRDLPFGKYKLHITHSK